MLSRTTTLISKVGRRQKFLTTKTTKTTSRNIFLSRAVFNGILPQHCDLWITRLTIHKDPNIGAIVITGSKKAFAAGADIKEMAPKTYIENYQNRLFDNWSEVTKIQKPIIAAVNGYALGGGCELAMSCDIIIAGDRAKFGQPEIKLGTIPGVGGTQRLTKAIGKSKAMELTLTGDFLDAQDAEKAGLVSRVVDADGLLDEATKVAEKIASFSHPIVAMAKECVNKSFETPLKEGLEFERRIFYSTFATADQKEGMQSFIDKTKPQWTHK